MIPILYESTETSFTSNGICRLVDTISCKVTEERNGVYECEFEYPITGKHFSDIYEGRIIACTHDNSGDVQPFDIYSHSAPMDGVVTFYAHHISYRLGEITLRPFTANSCTATLQAFVTYSTTTNPFTFWTDKAVSGDFTIEEPVTLKAMLGGTRGSILDVYGTGEYEFDKFTVKLHLHRGEDTEVEIRYGKNLADIQEDVDYSDSYTGVVPYWIGQDDNQQDVLVHLENWVLNSGNTSYGGRHIIVPMDLSSDFDDAPTVSQLQARAQTRLADGEAWLPNHTIKVDFVQLWQTEEFKDYAPLQRVRLCDTISVFYPKMGITATNQKIVSVEYNVLLERYDSMTIGNAYTRFGDLITSESKRQIEEATEAIRKIISGTNYVLESEMEQAIQDATSLITGGLGGYVVVNYNANGKPEEICILDNEDINQAQNVWRWNKNGLGFSSTGYNGTYSTAITSNGQIVADFVSTGTLDANLIKAGVLTDALGRNYWDLISGRLEIMFESNRASMAYIDAFLSYSWYTSEYPSATHGPIGFATYYDLYRPSASEVDTTGIFLIPNWTLNNPLYAQTSKGGGNNGWSDSANAGALTSIYVNESTNWTDYITRIRIAGHYTIHTAPMTNTDNGAIFSFGESGFLYVSNNVGKIAQIAPSSSLPNSSSMSSYNKLIHLSTWVFSVKLSSTAYMFIKDNATDWFNVTTNSHNLIASSSNLKIDGTNLQKASTSARRYKHSIKLVTDSILDPHRLYDLNAKQFIYNAEVGLQYEDMKMETLIGFIAEDVDEVYPNAVIHGEDGQIESWDERRIIPPMLELIKEQKQQIDSLEERVAVLEQKLEGILCTLS